MMVITMGRGHAWGDFLMTQMLRDAQLAGIMPVWAPTRGDVRMFFDVARAEAWAAHRARHAPWCSSCGEEWGW